MAKVFNLIMPALDPRIEPTPSYCEMDAKQLFSLMLLA